MTIRTRRSRPADGEPDPAWLAALTHLELKVARRADELSRAGAPPADLKLACWLQAEQEVLDGRVMADALQQLAPRDATSATP